MYRFKQDLQTAMTHNEIIRYAYSRYLNHNPRILDTETVQDFSQECNCSIEDAFLSLFAVCCGLECDVNPTHRELERRYLRTGVRRLDPTVYQNDPYYQTVRMPNVTDGRWELGHGFYAPFEPFVCDHPVVGDDLREIPQIGYFTQRFDFPSVREGGVEWMTVTPNEIETMKEPIEKSHGRVLTLGLGLGYFAFRAAEKPNVESVTVIEHDPTVIELFQTHLLPQFPHKEKIKVICDDAFAYVESKMTPTDFDYIFADTWHDPADGLEMYLRLRRIEKKRGLQNVDYWIEPSLLSCLRGMVWDKLTDPTSPMQLRDVPAQELLSDAFLRRLAPDIRQMGKDS